jgi:hypothetical protein
MCTKIPAKQATYACYDLTRIQKKFIGYLTDEIFCCSRYDRLGRKP